MAKKNAAKGLGKKGVVPSKQTMNFARHKSNINFAKLIPILVLVIAAALLFAKFGFLDQLDKVAAANNELSAKQDLYLAKSEQLKDYDALANEYGRYSYGWMTDSETGIVDRMDTIKLIRDKIMSLAVVEDYAVNENVLTLNVHGITLNQASDIVKDLESSSIVESATVYSAAAEDGSEASIYMRVILAKEVEEA